ncbi:hypothetical protein VDGE_30564 [Verticillium dahliae]|uniref:Uncharacterized protein n=1 Tax=Verticillium dahliae TaxID=27337 RepID=A0A444RT23_VERDA|nr:hypothetical protein VDGE_30564 [Verticillium dahliae]
MLPYEYLQTVTVLYKVAIYGRGKELRKYTFILQARRQLSSGPTSWLISYVVGGEATLRLETAGVSGNGTFGTEGELICGRLSPGISMKSRIRLFFENRSCVSRLSSILPRSAHSLQHDNGFAGRATAGEVEMRSAKVAQLSTCGPLDSGRLQEEDVIGLGPPARRPVSLLAVALLRGPGFLRPHGENHGQWRGAPWYG